jgi:hypothetical protein
MSGTNGNGVYKLPPFFAQIDYGAQVREAWGDEWLKKEIVYRWPNGRTFWDSIPFGIYSGTNG